MTGNLPVKVLSGILLITTIGILFSIEVHASSSSVSKTYPGGVEYKGELNSRGIPHGKGTFTWADGSHYTGDLADGIMTGKGVFTWPDGSHYSGEFEGGQMTGEGTLTWADGSRYKGTLLSRVSSAEDSAKIHYNMGVEYASEGKLIQARDEFRVVLKMDPRLITAQSSLKVIDAAIALHFKKEAVMHNFKGAIFGYKGMVEKSITEYTKAIEVDPKIAAAYNNRGDAYVNIGRYGRAISDFTKAIEIEPGNAIAYTNRGNAYSEKGDYDRAISDFTKAIEIDPEHALAYTNRGFVYMMSMDEKTMACKDLKRACELGNCRNYEITREGGHCK